MNLSIICNTINRKYHLKRLLFALSRQTYDDFEVIIVNGPSEDGTDKILLEYKDEIKIAKCEAKRLGVSRNIGIANAAGDVCVFIDDDAVPGHERWLEDIVECYKDPKVGGVGGPVYNLQGGTQFENGYVDIWGLPHTIGDKKDNFNKLDGLYFDYLMGCNCSFRTDVLHQVGGFDEFYDYFHDESDLSIRIIKAGYKIIHLTNAYAFHELASGHIRKDRYHLDWYTILKSQTYFGVINSGDYERNINERVRRVKKVAEKRLQEFKTYYECGYINRKELDKFNRMWKDGVEEGLAAGVKGARILLKECRVNSNFKKYNKEFFKDTLCIVMVCENFDINDPKDGIACYTARLAKDYAALGCCVHVVSIGDKPSFNLMDNVNIHTVAAEKIDFPLLQGKNILNRVLTASYEVMKKIVQLDSVFHIDVIETPLWNSIGIITSYLVPNIPMCLRIETPLKMVVNTQSWTDTTELQLLEEMEARMLDRADKVLYISDSIKQTIEDLYDVNLEGKSSKNYLGIEPEEQSPNIVGSKIKVFFIGRLERRKGIHVLLSIIPCILDCHPDVEFRIAGDDGIVDHVLGDSFKENFKRETNNKYEDKVIFLGKIDKDEKEKELRECDIFVAPSLYESFGIVLIEAMRYGKPVIGCAVGGMKEVVENGMTGLLVKPDDASELRHALDRLISDVSMRERLGENAYLSVNNKFNNIIQAKESLTIYRSTITKKNESESMLDGILQEFILYREKNLLVSNGGKKIESEGIISDLFVNLEKKRGKVFEFPWKMVNAGERIIIYGGGAVGKSYIMQLEEIPYCTVVAICDRNPKEVEGIGFPVISIEELKNIKDEMYDRIIVAIKNSKVAYSIMDTLTQLGIIKDRIIWNSKYESN